jgi:hypothetical protein
MSENVKKFAPPRKEALVLYLRMMEPVQEPLDLPLGPLPITHGRHSGWGQHYDDFQRRIALHRSHTPLTVEAYCMILGSG